MGLSSLNQIPNASSNNRPLCKCGHRIGRCFSFYSVLPCNSANCPSWFLLYLVSEPDAHPQPMGVLLCIRLGPFPEAVFCIQCGLDIWAVATLGLVATSFKNACGGTGLCGYSDPVWGPPLFTPCRSRWAAVPGVPRQATSGGGCVEHTWEGDGLGRKRR